MNSVQWSENTVGARHGLETQHTAQTALAKCILEMTLKHRRLLPEHTACAQQPCDGCYAPHLDKVLGFMERQQPIHFFLPAFPAKSPNPQKTLGPDPDMGERVALCFLQSLCHAVREVYPLGARITICSDGRVFGDLVKVTDEYVSRYRRGIANLIKELGAEDLDQYTLDDEFTLEDFDALREELLVRHAVSLTELRDLVREGGAARALFDGIHRFVYEDHRALLPDLSANQVRRRAKLVAYRVIQRSNAWSSVVAKRFPHSVRLSIHPQHAHSDKLGIGLVRCKNVWGTPWHGVVVEGGDGFWLMKRCEAEALDAELVTLNGRPSHYVLQQPTGVEK
jgi:pyoverdine/dityrosine biosynthesis protein Dit1